MLESFREALGREDVRSISRRYFVSNGFDGTLTATGLVVGSYLSGVTSGLTVFKIGMGALVGLATSGIWSIWEIERAEKLSELHEKEEAMLRNLEGTRIHDMKLEGRNVNAMMSGLGPIISILLILFPFLLEPLFLSMLQATAISILLGVLILFGFGAYMGKISKQKWYMAGLRMGLAGLFVVFLNMLLPG